MVSKKVFSPSLLISVEVNVNIFSFNEESHRDQYIKNSPLINIMQGDFGDLVDYYFICDRVEMK